MDLKTMLILLSVLIVIGIIKSITTYSKNKELAAEHEGKHLADFKISSVIRGYIAENHLIVKEGWDLGAFLMPKILDIDLSKATYIGFIAQGGSRSVQADFVKLYDANNKQVGPAITLSNINQVRTLFDIVRQHAPHIEIAKQGTII